MLVAHVVECGPLQQRILRPHILIVPHPLAAANSSSSGEYHELGLPTYVRDGRRQSLPRFCQASGYFYYTIRKDAADFPKSHTC